MLSEKITSVAIALSELASEVDEKTWQKLSCIRQELIDAAEVARYLEKAPLNIQIIKSHKKSLPNLDRYLSAGILPMLSNSEFFYRQER